MILKQLGHEARARFSQAPFRTWNWLSPLQHIGALTPCQKPTQPATAYNSGMIDGTSLNAASGRTHESRWRPCEHTTDVIPNDNLHSSPGLTLRAAYYAATLMAHTPDKQMIESMSAVRECDRNTTIFIPYL